MVHYVLLQKVSSPRFNILNGGLRPGQTTNYSLLPAAGANASATHLRYHLDQQYLNQQYLNSCPLARLPSITATPAAAGATCTVELKQGDGGTALGQPTSEGDHALLSSSLCCAVPLCFAAVCSSAAVLCGRLRNHGRLASHGPPGPAAAAAGDAGPARRAADPHHVVADAAHFKRVRSRRRQEEAAAPKPCALTIRRGEGGVVVVKVVDGTAHEVRARAANGLLRDGHWLESGRTHARVVGTGLPGVAAGDAAAAASPAAAAGGEVAIGHRQVFGRHQRNVRQQ